jgi:hypothetical protein
MLRLKRLVALCVRVSSVKYKMRFFEIHPTKPLTPQQSRIRALQQSVEAARTRLKAERDRQRRERDLLRQRRLKLQTPSV